MKHPMASRIQNWHTEKTENVKQLFKRTELENRTIQMDLNVQSWYTEKSEAQQMALSAQNWRTKQTEPQQIAFIRTKLALRENRVGR